MKRGKTRKPQIAFKAPDEMRAYIIDLANSTNVNASDLLREAMEIYRDLRETLTTNEWTEAKHRAAMQNQSFGKMLVKTIQPTLRTERSPKK